MESFELFFQYVKKRAEKLPVDETKLKHKRKKPNYSIIQFISGQESSSASYHSETVDDEFRQIFFEALDHIISAIQDRFDQPSFQTYSRLEELLLYASRGETHSDGIDQLNDLYGDEVDVSALQFELALFKEMFDDIP